MPSQLELTRKFAEFKGEIDRKHRETMGFQGSFNMLCFPFMVLLISLIYIDFVFFFVLHIFVNAVSTSNIIKCEGFKFSVLPGSCGLSSQLTNPMIIQYIYNIYIHTV